MLNPRIAVTIDNKPYTLALDFGAMRTLQLMGIPWQRLTELTARTKPEDLDLDLLAKVLCAMTSTGKTPLTLEDLDRLNPLEAFALMHAIVRAVEAAMDVDVGEKPPAGAKPGAAAGARSGTGAKRSRRR
jgi:hypothetical protein